MAVTVDILKNYKFDQPFHTYFNALCKLHKNWGSKDRRIYRSLCYAYFRLGHSASDGPLEEQILRAYQLKENSEQILSSVEVFKFTEMVSCLIDIETWTSSLQTQKPVYLQLRTGKENEVLQFLKTNKIEHELLGPKVVQIPAESKCNLIIESGLAWIMDLSSQNAANEIQIEKNDFVWDACAGAGGKSLFLKNKYDFDFNLTASDSRLTILENLKKRFKLLSFPLHHIELSDLRDQFQLSKHYDKIILDVSCTGSGTWGRTPENILGFEEGKTAEFSLLQRSIFKNVINHLKRNGSLYYITCSVFKEENEENTKFFAMNYGLKIEKELYIQANDKNSDTLFISELKFA